MGRGKKKPSYFKLKPSEAHTTDEMLKVFHSEEVKGTLNCDLYVEVRFFFCFFFKSSPRPTAHGVCGEDNASAHMDF